MENTNFWWDNCFWIIRIVIIRHCFVRNLKSTFGFRVLSWCLTSMAIHLLNEPFKLKKKKNPMLTLSSVQFSHSVMSDSLRPHELQYTRPPCPSPTSRVYSNSCPSSQWCHPAFSSSVVPFSFCPQSLPASGSFPMSQLCMRWPKYWSFSFSISPPNEYPGLIYFWMDWLDLLEVQGTLKSLLQHRSSGMWKSLFLRYQLEKAIIIVKRFI